MNSKHSACVLVHGGAGALQRSTCPPEAARSLLIGLDQALRAGAAALEKHASALIAVEASVVVLENDASFNAGRGAVLTSDETVELDAAIMNGADRSAGAVACVRTTKNPVRLARALLDEADQLMLCGNAADRFAATNGLEQVDPDYFITEVQRQRRRATIGRKLDHDSGTVGAVARDRHGHLAAATSTGGITNKSPGRIGDTPLIGVGTWADNATCAISATGTGERIIRACLAHSIDAKLRYLQRPLQLACDEVLADNILGPDTAGCIAISAGGETAFSFTTRGMPRGLLRAGEAPLVALFADDQLLPLDRALARAASCSG